MGSDLHIRQLYNSPFMLTKLDSMNYKLVSRMVDELNQMDIGGGMHHATQIQEQLRKLGDDLKVPSDRMNGGNTNSNGSPPDEGGGRSNYLSRFKYHVYHGRHNILPQNFVLPTLTLSAFIAYFLLGNSNTGVPPLRLVSTDDLKHSNASSNLKMVSDMKKLMKYVEEAG